MEGLGALLRGWGPPPEMKELGIIMGGGDTGTPRGERWGAFKEVGGTLKWGGGLPKGWDPPPPPGEITGDTWGGGGMGTPHRDRDWGHLKRLGAV